MYTHNMAAAKLNIDTNLWRLFDAADRGYTYHSDE